MSELKRTVIPIMLLGDYQCGKTSLLLRFLAGEFDKQILQTICKESYIYGMQLHGYDLKMKIWDTSGQERFKSISMGLVENMGGFILTYSIANRESFKNLDECLESLRKKQIYQKNA